MRVRKNGTNEIKSILKQKGIITKRDDASLNPDVQTPPIDDVDWDSLKLIFWPRIYTDEEKAEPDIVLISNKWILVVEVKLQSGLGDS